MMPAPTMQLTKLANVPRRDDLFSSASVAPVFLLRRRVCFLMLSVWRPWGVDMVWVRVTGLVVEGRKNGDAGLV